MIQLDIQFLFPLSFLLRQSGCLLCLIMLYSQLIDLIIKEKRISSCKSFTEHFWIGNRTASHKSVQKNHCHYHNFLKKKKNPQITRILSLQCPFKLSVGGINTRLQFSHHTEIFKRSTFCFKKYLCYYIPPLQLETFKSKPQLHGSRTRHTALLHCDKTKTSSKTSICHSGAWKPANILPWLPLLPGHIL